MSHEGDVAHDPSVAVRRRHLPFAGSAKGRKLSKLPEERAHVVDEQRRLLEGGEMAALGQLAPVLDVAEVGLHPASYRRHDLAREHRDSGRHADLVDGAAPGAEALPVETAAVAVTQ